jgi:hypothetical protein
MRGLKLSWIYGLVQMIWNLLMLQSSLGLQGRISISRSAALDGSDFAECCSASLIRELAGWHLAG